jgi:hypothetical protein
MNEKQVISSSTQGRSMDDVIHSALCALDSERPLPLRQIVAARDWQFSQPEQLPALLIIERTTQFRDELKREIVDKSPNKYEATLIDGAVREIRLTWHYANPNQGNQAADGWVAGAAGLYCEISFYRATEGVLISGHLGMARAPDIAACLDFGCSEAIKEQISAMETARKEEQEAKARDREQQKLSEREQAFVRYDAMTDTEVSALRQTCGSEEAWHIFAYWDERKKGRRKSDPALENPPPAERPVPTTYEVLLINGRCLKVRGISFQRVADRYQFWDVNGCPIEAIRVDSVESIRDAGGTILVGQQPDAARKKAEAEAKIRANQEELKKLEAQFKPTTEEPPTSSTDPAAERSGLIPASGARKGTKITPRPWWRFWQA